MTRLLALAAAVLVTAAGGAVVPGARTLVMAADCSIASGSYVSVQWQPGGVTVPNEPPPETFVGTWGNVYTSGRCTGDLTVVAVPQMGNVTFAPARCQPDPDINATVGGCFDPVKDIGFVGAYPAGDSVVITAYYSIALVGTDGSLVSRTNGNCVANPGTSAAGTVTCSIPT